MIGGLSKLNNISTVGAAQLIFIHRRVVHKQIIYINRRSGPIDIYTSEGCPLIKMIILIRGLGECERVGEDSGSELVM